MKVLFCSTSSNLKSGASWSLLRMIIQLRNLGVEPYVILQTHGDIENEFKKNNIPYKVIYEKWLGIWLKHNNYSKDNTIKEIMKTQIKKIINYFAYKSLEKLIIDEKFDLIHLNGLPTVNGAKIANKLHIQYIWHIREFLEEDLGYSFVNKKEAKSLLSNASEIIAISNAVKEKYENQLSLEKIKVIYNGVNTKKYFCKRDILENKDHITVMIAGRVTEKKGQLDLLRAINNSNIKNKIRCIVVGPHDTTGYYESLVRYSKVNNLRVEFIDYTSHIEKYLQNSDVVCVCSKKEAFGRITIEAMLSGCLIIGANSGGTTELINEGITGYLYDVDKKGALSSCLEKVYLNRLISAKIARLGQKEAIKFNDFENARQVKLIYNELV